MEEGDIILWLNGEKRNILLTEAIQHIYDSSKKKQKNKRLIQLL